MSAAIQHQFSEDADVVPLYQHTKRADWGLAILAWEGGDQRRYQFEDGHLRTFKEGYYGLLTEVDRPLEEAEQLAQELLRKLDLSEARKDLVRQAEQTGRRTRLFTMDDQIEVFRRQYPEGFADPTWISEFRGAPGERKLKRQRDPAVARAQELLSCEALAGHTETGDFRAVHAALVEVLRSTDLIQPSKDLVPLAAPSDIALVELARALNGVLWGTELFQDRLQAWISALIRCAGQELRADGTPPDGPSWPLVTAVLGLVHPLEHVCVRPSTFRAQARWMAPRMKYDPLPTTRRYARYRAMSRSVMKALQTRNFAPRDLMDVHDFMWATLRPGAQKLLDTEPK